MILLLFLGVSVLWIGWRMLYAKWWKRGLSIHAAFCDGWVCEGQTSSLTEEIVNDKLLPVPVLEVRLAVSRHLEFLNRAKENTSVTDQTYKRDVFSLLPRQKIVRTLVFTCRRRGYYQISDAGLSTSDLLSGRGYLAEEPQNSAMYVYPAPADTGRIRMVCQAVSGMVLTQNRLYPDPFEFSGIREYERTDPMRQINWKASARMGSLMVNQYDSTTSSEVTVFLDVEDASILKYEALVEESIRIAASLCARLTNSRMEARLVSNGVDAETGKALDYRMPAGAARFHEMNRKLARLVTDETPPISAAELFRREKGTSGAGRTCVMVSKNRTPELESELHQASREGIGVLWVCPVEPGEEKKESGPKGVSVLWWETR